MKPQLPKPSFSPENPYFGPFKCTGQDFAYAWTWEVHMPHRRLNFPVQVIRGGYTQMSLMLAFKRDVKNQWRKLAKALEA